MTTNLSLLAMIHLFCSLSAAKLWLSQRQWLSKTFTAGGQL